MDIVNKMLLKVLSAFNGQIILTAASNTGSQRVVKEVLLKGGGQGATGANINIATFWDSANMTFPETAVGASQSLVPSPQKI